jgi:hypothetical protein
LDDDLLNITKTNINSAVRITRKDDPDPLFVEETINNSVSSEIDIGKSLAPELDLNFDNLSVVEFSSELLINLDLTLRFERIVIGDFIKNFEGNISYDEKAKRRFANLVFKNNGFLEKESNYFTLLNSLLSEGTTSTVLRNSRVLLFVRGLDLSYITVQKILTAGLVHLINAKSEAELIVYVKSLIPNHSFEISIKSKQNTYVRIGVEKPIFNV